MKKTLLAGFIVMSLSACDSDSRVLELGNNLDQTETSADGDTTGGIDSDTDSGGTGAGGIDTDTDTAGETGAGGIDTDTDTGGTGTGGNDTDNDTSTGEDGSDPATDDDKYDDTDASGSDDDKFDDDENSDDTDNSNDNSNGNNDGGQIDDDAGSSTSDGGQTDDDSGSSTSDGGQTGDDDGSSTSDGGQTNPDDDTSNDGNNGTGERITDAGSFESDNVGGSIIRRSVLGSNEQSTICTTASNPQNFSDTRVGDFILHNNAWRPWRAFPGYEWEQCIYTNLNDSLVGWNYDWGPGQTGINGSPNASGDFYVRSYPELIYGVKDEFRTSAPQSVTGFPIELSALPNISIDYSYNGPQYGEPRIVDASNNPRFPNGTSISGERNVAIETFMYNADAAGNCTTDIVTRNGGSNHVYEVMVWLDAGAERLPAGPNDFVANLTIRGEDYKVYTKDSDSRYIAFVAQNPQSTGTIFWNDYIDWAKENAHLVQQRFGARSNSVQIQDDWCVANIIVGTEIFWGSGNIDIYDWTITQSQ